MNLVVVYPSYAPPMALGHEVVDNTSKASLEFVVKLSRMMALLNAVSSLKPRCCGSEQSV